MAQALVPLSRLFAPMAATPSRTKTVRFTQVVKRSGQPHAHTLWLAPEKDPELKRALAANRVMTVESGGASGKTDVGFVGFDPARKSPAQLLIFPKTLEPFAGARVVGIKFDLVEQPKFAKPRNLKRTVATQRKTHAPKRKPRPLPPLAKFEPKQVESEPETDSKIVPMPPSADRKPAPSRRKRPAAADAPLAREVRAALKELEAGKAVAAYRRLQRALDR